MLAVPAGQLDIHAARSRRRVVDEKVAAVATDVTKARHAWTPKLLAAATTARKAVAVLRQEMAGYRRQPRPPPSLPDDVNANPSSRYRPVTVGPWGATRLNLGRLTCRPAVHRNSR